MNHSQENVVKQFCSIALYMLGVAALFVGWVALLGFPWEWVIPAAVIVELIAICLVLLFERSASDVSGASGWMIFAFIMGHTWLFVGALVLRIIVWAIQ